MNGPGPQSETATLPTPGRPVRCPRCDAPIEGVFKFCPACALRLRAGAEEPVVEPGPPRSAWKSGFLVASGLAVLLASALLGVFLFRPHWFPGAQPTGTDPPPREFASLAEPLLRVDDIPGDLVELPPEDAFEVPLDVVPGLDVPMPTGDQTVREHWDGVLRARQPGREPKLVAYLGYAMRVLKYEVTRGQYLEFLRDLEAHRERVPHAWVEFHRVRRPEDVDLFDHVPEPWIVRDVDGVPRSFDVPLADRNLPVTHVSYVDALGFTEWASARFGLEVRIPFAMEWVRAARAGRLDYEWPWGDRQLIYACNNLASWGRPQYVHYVYSEPLPGGGRSPEGLYAMAGNVSEFALDHDLVLVNQALGNPPKVTWKQREDTPETTWAYGGSFRSGILDCTAESRQAYRKDDRSRDDVGFRVIVRVPPK